MSTEQIVFTDFESRLKGYGIEITAFGRDDQSATVTVKGEDIKEFYEMNPATFHEKYGDDANKLAELFTAIKGIKVSEF